MPGENGDTPKKKCFIVSSIGEANSLERIHLEFYREFILEPVFSELPNYEFSGSNEIDVPGMIDSQIINHLLEDDLVIADMTFLNANVFYEIGLRHFARKPIIHTFRRSPGFKIPFDVQSYRAIEYDTSRPAEFKNARDSLRAQIAHIESPAFQVDTPMTRAIGSREVRAHGTDMEKMILERVESLEVQLSLVRMMQDPTQISPTPFELKGMLPIKTKITMTYSTGRKNLSLFMMECTSILNSSGIGCNATWTADSVTFFFPQRLTEDQVSFAKSVIDDTCKKYGIARLKSIASHA